MIHRQAPRTRELRGRRRLTQLRRPTKVDAVGSVPRDAADHILRRVDGLAIAVNRVDGIHPTDAVIEAVADEKGWRCGGIDRHAVREVETGLRRWTTIPTEPQVSAAGNRVNPLVAHLSDHAVVTISDENAAGGIDRDAHRVAQQGIGREVGIPGKSGLSQGPGDDRDVVTRAGQVDLADNIIKCVGDVELFSGRIQRHTHWIGKPGRRGRLTGMGCTRNDASQRIDIVGILVPGWLLIPVSVGICANDLVEGVEHVAGPIDGRHGRRRLRRAVGL